MHRVLKAPLTELRNPGIECGLGEYIVFRFVHAEFMILLKYRMGLHTHTHIDTYRLFEVKFVSGNATYRIVRSTS